MTILYNKNFDETIPWSDTSYQVALATGVVQTITIPGNATNRYSVRFSYNSTSNVFIGNNVTAATPGAGATTTVQYLELRPGGDGTTRYVKGGDVLSFITPDASAYVGVRLMTIPA